jgi:hypothetical protein
MNKVYLVKLVETISKTTPLPGNSPLTIVLLTKKDVVIAITTNTAHGFVCCFFSDGFTVLITISGFELKEIIKTFILLHSHYFRQYFVSP